eukprot:GEMP01011929.1.p1 GENE.GEMP01011929.1~~GEMP01011929.1.p1  ORF type:complete len:735 (+),score=144.69 GEMP01011929.1:112-2316(+)
MPQSRKYTPKSRTNDLRQRCESVTANIPQNASNISDTTAPSSCIKARNAFSAKTSPKRRASIVVLQREGRTSSLPTPARRRRSHSVIPIRENNLLARATASTFDQRPYACDEVHRQEDVLPRSWARSDNGVDCPRLKPLDEIVGHRPLVKMRMDLDSNWKEKRASNEDLWYAVEKGDLEDVRKALETSDPNSKLLHDWTALHLAASKASVPVKCAQLLVEHKADLEARTRTLYTPLALACERGKLEMVKAFVGLKADANYVVETGDSLCHLATANGHRAIVEYLLETFPRCARTTNNVGQRPAEMAHTLEMQNLFNREDYEPLKNYCRTAIGDVLIHNARRDVVLKLLFLQGKERVSPRTMPVKSMSSMDLARLTRKGSPRMKRRMKPFVTLKKRIVCDKVGTDTFIVKSSIGKGSFGEVYHVIHRDSHASYAMKVLPKSRIIGQNLLQYAMTERNVLSYIHHPFIVSLHFAFQTPGYLVLVLAFCPGGNLQQLISRERTLEVPLARLYVAEILLALEHLHERNIIYRDLKPDNVVLDIQGHALLTDFGLSKEGVDNIHGAQSFCGSAAYLAPEMLQNCGHGHTVDLYGLGVLLFEMLAGWPPYYASNKEQMFRNIKHGRMDMPVQYKGSRALSLIEQLMDRVPARRIGMVKTSDVRHHEFFLHVDWAVIQAKNFTPLPSTCARLMRSQHLWQIPKDSYPHATNPLIKEAATPQDKQHSSHRYTIEGWEFVRDN